ncbi:hypothetical protein FHT72_006373 [Rhizobium sp. BK077]|nr:MULTISPECIES: DUF4432 family protein [unclassified Rhizobium]MBB3302948.1 hypothetical protein [Rhizobium sp. BK112]MBB3371841.1 hypothetical protein [Rhizobium sp. BK077]MBB4182808.1 hypothetical protein [Rhizobium sp. BK109]
MRWACAVGLGLEIAVNRGFDVAALSFMGLNIGWHSPTQMVFPTHDPDSQESLGFFRNQLTGQRVSPVYECF